jgi:hypothetical protein
MVNAAVIIISIISSICSIAVVAVMVFLYFKASEASKQWQCIESKPDKAYIIGRMTDDGNSECMYTPDGVGCYILTPKHIDNDPAKPIDKAKLKTECNNFIKNYPTVTPVDGTTTALGPYTCGQSPSTHYSLWSVTGYEDPESDCNKILNEKGVVPEAQKYLGSLFG